MTNSQTANTDAPLSGRVALVTGVSRDIGIGAAVATRLHDLGATVYATGWPPHDAEMPWGERESGVPFPVFRHDLEDATTPAALVEEVWATFGGMDKWEIRNWTHNPANVPEWEDPKGSSLPIPLARMMALAGAEDAATQANLIADHEKIDRLLARLA